MTTKLDFVKMATELRRQISDGNKATLQAYWHLGVILESVKQSDETPYSDFCKQIGISRTKAHYYRKIGALQYRKAMRLGSVRSCLRHLGVKFSGEMV
jgi:hypothetical protein